MSNISKDFVTKNGIIVKGTGIVTGLTSQTNALQVDGGASIAKNVIIGSTTTIYGQTIIENTSNAFSSSTGALIVQGGLTVNQDLFVGGTLFAIIEGVSSTSTNIAGGTDGQLVYQISPGQTGFHGPGTIGDILLSNGTSGPNYTSSSSVYVGSAVLSENLYGGTAGSIPYQSGTNTTTFITIGPNNSVLMSNGNTPNWTISPTFGGDVVVLGNLTVQGTSTIIDSTVTNVVDPIITLGGGPGGIPPSVGDQKDRGIAFIWTGTQAGLDIDRIGFFGFDYSTGYFTFITSATINHEVVSPDGGTTRGAIDVNFAGGLAGSIPIQSAPDTTTFIAPGTLDGYVLTWDSLNSTATWQSITSVVVDFSNTATNLKDGQTGEIPYQIAPGVTSFIGTGTEYNLLQMGADSTASFVSTSTVQVGFAANLLGGDVNYIPYQTASNTTIFSNSFTFDGTVLNVPEIVITSSTSATNTLTGALQVAGGASIQGDLWVGGRIYLGGVGLDTISGTTGTFLDIITTGTITSEAIITKLLTATEYLHVTTTTNDIASYGRDLDPSREALGVVGAIHTLGDIAVGGILYAGMNDGGDVAGENPHNKTIDGVFVANSMLSGGTYDGIVTTATQTIDTFDKTVYTSAKYIIQVTDEDKVHSQEIMLIHNNTSVYMTQYGIITSAGQLGAFSGLMTGTNILLNFTPNTATNMTINVVRHSVISGLQAYG